MTVRTAASAPQPASASRVARERTGRPRSEACRTRTGAGTRTPRRRAPEVQQTRRGRALNAHAAGRLKWEPEATVPTRPRPPNLRCTCADDRTDTGWLADRSGRRAVEAARGSLARRFSSGQPTRGVHRRTVGSTELGSARGCETAARGQRSKRCSSRCIDGSFEASGGLGGSRAPTGMCSGHRMRYHGGESCASTMPSRALTRAWQTLQCPSYGFRFAIGLVGSLQVGAPGRSDSHRRYRRVWLRASVSAADLSAWVSKGLRHPR